MGNIEIPSYECSLCGRVYSPQSLLWRCECGGHLNLPLARGLSPSDVQTGEPSLWRYWRALPVDKLRPTAYFGEGMTPLVERSWGGRPAWFKLDYLFPSGSYKDRGSAIMVNRVFDLGVTSMHEDSSGNAGASVASYCAAAGAACKIYAPAHASEEKLAQIRAYGAGLIKVSGGRQNAAAAAMDAEGASFYAGHNWQPLFIEGVKTLAYELWEQTGWKAPDVIVVPIGGGALVLGLYRGFKELLGAGSIEKLPKIYACQAANCAPFHRAYTAGDPAVAALDESQVKPTLAEGVAVSRPVRVREVLKALDDCCGRTVQVAEDDITIALSKLASVGLYVEPTSGVAPAAAYDLFATSEIGSGERAVIVLTGNGLKTTGALTQLYGDDQHATRTFV